LVGMHPCICKSLEPTASSPVQPGLAEAYRHVDHISSFFSGCIPASPALHL